MTIGPLFIEGGNLRYRIGRWWIPDGLHVWWHDRGVHLYWRKSPYEPRRIIAERSSPPA